MLVVSGTDLKQGHNAVYACYSGMLAIKRLVAKRDA